MNRSGSEFGARDPRVNDQTKTIVATAASVHAAAIVHDGRARVGTTRGIPN